ncbi:MAG: hypothetical protein ACJ73E_00110 [Mycobacteriales bacterium]
MRRLRVVVLLVLVGLGMVPALPAYAGGWAVTLLDPLPDRVDAGKAYTVGYWVLQHGSHPYEGELGRTGLRLVGPDRTLEFDGRALPESAHYAVAIAVPAGKWRVYAMQGWFADFEVGTLTVPGGLVLRPSDLPVNVGGHSDSGAAPHWGAVHPPGGIAVQGDAVQPVREPLAAPAAPAVSAPGPERTPTPRMGIATALLVSCGVIALLASGLARPLRRRLRR